MRHGHGTDIFSCLAFFPTWPYRPSFLLGHGHGYNALLCSRWLNTCLSNPPAAYRRLYSQYILFCVNHLIICYMRYMSRYFECLTLSNLTLTYYTWLYSTPHNVVQRNATPLYSTHLLVGTHRKYGWACATLLPNPLTHLRPKSPNFPSLFMTLPNI